MRRLLLMRHAKAETPGSRPDFDRALASRGKHAAPLVGEELQKSGIVPDRILCSPSARTRQTLELAAAKFDADPETEFPEELYNAETDIYLEQIRLHGGRAETLMVVGHNPSTQEAAGLLAGPGGDLPLPADYPTGAVAVFDFDLDDWADLRPRTGRLRRFVRPRELE